MNHLSFEFGQLRDGLILWRNIGQGLWPIRHWPDNAIENYVLTLQNSSPGFKPERSFVFPTSKSRDLIFLIRLILKEFNPSVNIDHRFPAHEHPAVLLETILFALIGLAHPEEPGELTVDDVLAGH